MPVKPPAEVDLTTALVRGLLADQHPDLAALPVRPAVHGWDNATFRLGDDLAVRLPRREAAAHLLEHEQRWLPVLAALCPVPVPAPVRVGRPSERFRWSWSVVPWVAGEHAADEPVADRARWADGLAEALDALHVAAPATAPVNPVRGGALAGRAAALRARVDAGHLDGFGPGARAQVGSIWHDALAALAWPGPPVWVHGDPHPANLVARDGRLAGLLDFGDVTAGDPACDLATAWLTFDDAGRAAFRARVDALADARGPADPGRWQRAAGWALVMASAMVTHGDDDPVIGAIGTHALGELLRTGRPGDRRGANHR
ncbi:aminoglycoside phosphotransferase family protein [Cellulomonas sp. ACRRI]|uniref:aminoglycoside phosphotransferase family protein n=1 Tax=Cellulomonas sp. ACRRI TaxID=2918188 RepID=UPI001EF236EE|nr:aminoglycoside phosphotransferase family protein [Cellulomonas sp. ACRRI]MCG7285565.1 aminoglycoside phosphotransferase family protein [Cellulomonas sp. ACRRI]